jgi:hypothetical protein
MNTHPRCTINEVYSGDKICKHALYSDERTGCTYHPCIIKDHDFVKGLFWSLVSVGCIFIFGMILTAIIFGG